MRLPITALLAITFTTAAQAGVIFTYEAPGVQETTSTFQYVGVERFEGRAEGITWDVDFDTDFGTSTNPVIISGHYEDVNIWSATNAGGAGGAGYFAHAPRYPSVGYTLTLSASDNSPITYFGYWMSALDEGNQLEFYKNGSLVGSLNPTAIINKLGGCVGGQAANPYCGNPNPAFLGINGGEQYAFINAYFTDGDSFDTVKFYSTYTRGAYETDNHTVGYWLTQSGNTVPEPATWAMLIMGFGLVGVTMRRQNRKTAATA